MQESTVWGRTTLRNRVRGIDRAGGKHRCPLIKNQLRQIYRQVFYFQCCPHFFIAAHEVLDPWHSGFHLSLNSTTEGRQGSPLTHSPDLNCRQLTPTCWTFTARHLSGAAHVLLTLSWCRHRYDPVSQARNSRELRRDPWGGGTGTWTLATWLRIYVKNTK